MKNLKVIAISLTAAVLLIAVAFFIATQNNTVSAAASSDVASAQATTTPGASTTTTNTNKTHLYYNTYLQNLATDLGVGKDKLTQSMVQAEKDTIAQEVKDGKLTQDKATKLDQRIDKLAANGIYAPAALGHHHHHHHHGKAKTGATPTPGTTSGNK